MTDPDFIPVHFEKEKSWHEIVDDLTEVWHISEEIGARGQGPGLHTFLGMTWEEYQVCNPGAWNHIPSKLHTYIRAQHKRWVR